MLARRLVAHFYMSVVILVGSLILLNGILWWYSPDLRRFACYLLLSLLAVGLRVNRPAISGAMSVNFVFILIGLLELNLQESIVLGFATALAQSLVFDEKRPPVAQIAFQAANIVVAVGFSKYTLDGPLLRTLEVGAPVALLAAAVTFYFANIFPVCAVTALAEGRSLRKLWRESHVKSLPAYTGGAALAALFSVFRHMMGWQVAMLLLPIVYLLIRSYRLYVERLDDGRRHAEEIASLHLRTIEALALSIEAKDNNTHNHLQRVQTYAVEVGKSLGLSAGELEALRAASVLHDIGKLAVPEHIISKPGKLTPEEFEKMKIHPVVGAEILERVQFPYPVAPIVRAHHERWNGTGYPYGLKGEEIPIGARILAAVDCLDALASDRQYRRALPLDEAMARVIEESGISFDPRVVQVIAERYRELEQMAVASQGEAPLATEMKIERGEAPAAGFEQSASKASEPMQFLAAIAAARQEAQELFELAQELGSSLSLSETLSVLAVRLKRMVPFDAIAVYVLRDGTLVPEHVGGENFRLFSGLKIPVGQGLSGWVAENRKPIINGNPSVEPGYLNDPSKFSTLRSALAVPLEGVGGVVGVLALYHADRDAFTRDHLRILLAITSKVALSVENALKYHQAATSATTDFLTGLPNARSLFLRLDAELSRCRREQAPLAVLVCDLDGFKHVNDRFGHLVGNRVLKRVASGLEENCREYDYVARMGGDEFVLLLPGMSPEALSQRISHLRQVAIQAGLQVCQEDLLTMSVGCSFFPQDGTDAEELLAEADRSMYKAKRGEAHGPSHGLERLETHWPPADLALLQ